MRRRVLVVGAVSVGVVFFFRNISGSGAPGVHQVGCCQVRMCLQSSPDARPRMADILALPFLSKHYQRAQADPGAMTNMLP